MSSFFGLATGAPPPQQQQQQHQQQTAHMFAAPHPSPALNPAGTGGFATMTPHDLLALQQQQQQQSQQQPQPQPYQQPQYHAGTPTPATMSSLLSTSLQQQSHGFFTTASSVPPPSPGLPRPASAASSTASHLAPVKVQEGFFIPSDPTPSASTQFQSMLAPPPAAHMQQPYGTSSPMLVDAPTTPTTPHWPTAADGSIASSGPPAVSAAASWMSLGRTPGTPRGTTRAEALRIGSVPATAFRHHATQPGVHSPLATSFWDAAGSSVGSTAILGTSAGDDDHLAAALASTAPTGAASASAAAAAAASSLPLKSVQVLHEKRRRRRESHNAVERRRRDNINERIQEMGLLLPETYTGSDASTAKAHKGQILRKAVDYVGDLQRLLAQARDRHRELEQALRQLGVEPPEMADLDRQMDTLLTLPSHTVGTLMVAPAVLREQQMNQQMQMQPPMPLRADAVDQQQQQQMVFAKVPHVFPAASTTPEITMTAMVAGPSPNGAAGVVPTDAVDGLEQLLIPPAQQWVTTATTASMSGASASLSPTMVTPSLAPIPQQSHQQQQPVQQQQPMQQSPFQQPQYQQQPPAFQQQQPQQQQYQFPSQYQAPQQQQFQQQQQPQQPPTVVMYAAAPTAPGQPPQYYAIQQHQPAAQPHPPPPPHPYYVQAPTYQSYQQAPAPYLAGVAQPMQTYAVQGMPAGTIVMQAPTAQPAASAQPGGV
ncbi:hypothetical protein GGF32_003453 [Allomyces javanicus]|nr:hypothetical protein GGF32_003453 [Allomyces javanicus]